MMQASPAGRRFADRCLYTRRITEVLVSLPAVLGRSNLLSELSADGNVSRDEMERLRSWLEIDHGVDFPALPFLYETIDQISSDGEITEEELGRTA